MLMILAKAEEVEGSWFGKDMMSSITGRLFVIAVTFKGQLSRQYETCHWNTGEQSGLSLCTCSSISELYTDQHWTIAFLQLTLIWCISSGQQHKDIKNENIIMVIKDIYILRKVTVMPGKWMKSLNEAIFRGEKPLDGQSLSTSIPCEGEKDDPWEKQQLPWTCSPASETHRQDQSRPQPQSRSFWALPPLFRALSPHEDTLLLPTSSKPYLEKVSLSQL